ncbi:OsmC family peroxiredoxin [Thermoleophilia bacterium SCSIO 60948]|nr:OsmC family peroxiredoxin [Thermoleophilia bacterium SCSIO 60948]
MAIDRTASITWKGDLQSGEGTLTSGTGAFGPLDLTFARRAGEPEGHSSPEELIAAAHAGCYAMAFSNALAQAGNPADQLDVEATCSFDAKEIKITSVALKVRGDVPGLDDSEFRRLADEAEQSCPVSNALRGNVDITVDASLNG